MAITFDYYVAQGTYGITNRANLTFGTGGLATCVGIIATLNSGNNFCGHMDSDVEPRNQEERFQFMKKVGDLLNNTIPVNNVIGVAYSTGGTFASTQCITAKILDMFPGAVDKGYNTNLYITASGIKADNQQYQNGANLVNNGAFTITSL